MLIAYHWRSNTRGSQDSRAAPWRENNSVGKPHFCWKLKKLNSILWDSQRRRHILREGGQWEGRCHSSRAPSLSCRCCCACCSNEIRWTLRKVTMIMRTVASSMAAWWWCFVSFVIISSFPSFSSPAPLLPSHPAKISQTFQLYVPYKLARWWLWLLFGSTWGVV